MYSVWVLLIAGEQNQSGHVQGDKIYILNDQKEIPEEMRTKVIAVYHSENGYLQMEKT